MSTQKNPEQLSLFEQENEFKPEAESIRTTSREVSVFEFLRARLDHEPEMSADEIKRFVRILVQNSFKSID